ncbi:hypothetical protein ACO0QE_004016 [Hanseniaspora vineae]
MQPGLHITQKERNQEERKDKQKLLSIKQSLHTFKKKKKKIAYEKLKPLTFAIPNHISLNNLSNLININYEVLEARLVKLGFKNLTSKYILTKEYIELILQEFNYDLSSLDGQGASSEEITSANCYNELKQPIQPKYLVKRPPIVTIMGHVDHGKTTILDHLRKSNIVNAEHGGITQHIGAFQVITPVSKSQITFLDTPGHSAFLKMRERGAAITDIIILVVSLEDSVKPQTLEAMKHIKKYFNLDDMLDSSKHTTTASSQEDSIVPLIVAVTKIDKFKNNKREYEQKLNKLESDLMTQGIPIEKIGGDVAVVPISAKTGENMDALEEQIVFLSELLDLKAEQNHGQQGCMEGYIIESSKDLHVGPKATVLVKRGEIKMGNIILCGKTYCKVKTMKNDLGENISTNKTVKPGQVVQLTGWKDLPLAGDEVLQVKNENIAKKAIAKKLHLLDLEYKNSQIDKINEQQYEHVLLREEQKDGKFEEEDLETEQVDTANKGPQKVNFIIKADVSGSVEAIKECIEPIGNSEVQVGVVSSSVGVPTESDLKLAKISNAQILCFNLPNIPNEIINNTDKIVIEKFNVIYKLIEFVVETCSSKLAPIIQENKLATIEIKNVMSYTMKKKTIKIAGCKILQGSLKKNSLVKVMRGEGENQTCVYKGKLESLKQGKLDAAEIHKGQECGLTFEKFDKFETGDAIVVYEINEIKRHL